MYLWHFEHGAESWCGLQHLHPYWPNLDVAFVCLAPRTADAYHSKPSLNVRTPLHSNIVISHFIFLTLPPCMHQSFVIPRMWVYAIKYFLRRKKSTLDCIEVCSQVRYFCLNGASTHTMGRGKKNPKSWCINNKKMGKQQITVCRSRCQRRKLGGGGVSFQ